MAFSLDVKGNKAIKKNFVLANQSVVPNKVTCNKFMLHMHLKLPTSLVYALGYSLVA